MAVHVGHLNHSTTAQRWLASLLSMLASWRYRSSTSRDFRLDLLRGFCVFAMVVDHVGGASWLYALTGGNRAAVSAGEGFVFLSGLVAGLVYSRKMIRSGLAATSMALLQRARLLYLVTLGMTLAFVGLALGTDLKLWVDRSSGLGAGSLQDVIVGALTLRYTYHGSDILAIYTLLLTVSPALFFLLKAGKAHWLLAGSWLLWAAAALFPGVVHLWDIQNGQYFPIAAWQMLFVTGLVMGHAVVSAERCGPIRWSAALQSAMPWIATAAVLLAGVAWMRTFNPFGLLPGSSFTPTGLEYERWATGIWDKVYLGSGRLVAFAALTVISYGTLTLLWRPIERLVGWLLLPLGAGSLHAYVSHLFFVVIGLNLAALGFENPELIFQNTFAQLALVLIVWAAIQLPSALGDLRVALARAVPSRRLAVARGLAGVSAALAMLLLIGNQPVFSSPQIPVNEQIQAPQFMPPLPPVVGPSVSPPVVGPTLIPPTVPGEELMVPGLTAATEGPRSLPLRGGQLWPHAFMSPTLQRVMPYYVYLPPGYDTSTDSYPVVYLLHGYYGSFMEWAEVGIHQAADELILSGQIEPMIIVMPEGEQSYFVNHGASGPRWGDYIVTDVVNEIDRNFRTIPTADARAIGGLSMGGTGALHLAFTNPTDFGIVGAHAPTLKWDRPADKFAFADDEYYRSVNPLVEAKELTGFEHMIIMLDIGDEDGGWFTVDELYLALDGRGIASDLSYLPGAHAAEYWIEYQWDYLPAYDRAFRALRMAGSAEE